MHGIDDSTDLSFLVGRTLLAIQLGQCQLILKFDDDAAISVESSLLVAGEIDAVIDILERGYFKDLGPLEPALGTRVATAGVEGGRVRLGFEGGSVVELIEHDGPYESFQISCGPIYIVV